MKVISVRYINFMLFVSVCMLLAWNVQAGIIQVDWDEPGCVSSPQPNPYIVTYCNIQDAITDAQAGDTIMIADGTYQETLLIDKSLSIQAASPGNPPLLEIPTGTVNAVTITADDVTLDTLDFYQADTPSDAATILIPKEGPWPDYIIDYARISILNCNFEGGRRGMYVSVEDLTVDNCTFIDTYRDCIFLNGVAGSTTITNNDFVGIFEPGKKAILAETGSGQPYSSGDITIAYNTCRGKYNFFVFNHWGDIAQKLDLWVNHNSIDNVNSHVVTMYAAYTDVDSFEKFDSIMVENNIMSNNGGLAVYVNYHDYGGAPPPEDRGIPDDDQIVVRNNLCYQNTFDEVTQNADLSENYGYYNVPDMTPPGASMAMFDLSDNLNGDPLYIDPLHADNNFAVLPDSPALLNASDGTNIGSWQGIYPTPTPSVTPTPAPLPASSVTGNIFLLILFGAAIGLIGRGRLN